MKLTLGVLLILVMLDWFVFNLAQARGNGHGHDHGHDHEVNVTNNFYEVNEITEITENDYRIVDDDTMDAIMAGVMSVSAIHFSPSTRKVQLGVGVGNYRGHNALSIGVAKLIETEDSEFLLSLSASVLDENDSDFATGVGLTWLLGDTR